MPRTLLAAAVVAVALAACTGGNGNDGDRATPTTPVATTAPSGARPGENPFCDFVRGFTERFGRIDLSLTDPARFRAAMEEASTSIRDAQASAPEAVRADVATLNTYFQRFLGALQQANFDLSRLPPGSLQQLQAPEFAAASARLDAYARDNC
ncbi:MAG TPA: hypothetical protein VM263_02645 [Acidimicrobiales bacterium]|nr:hypothetical protein [Acidimicrobiales bacterium]